MARPSSYTSSVVKCVFPGVSDHSLLADFVEIDGLRWASAIVGSFLSCCPVNSCVTLLHAIILVIFLLGVSFFIHNFLAIQEPQAKMMVNFMKNMGLLGLVLMTVAIPWPWPMSLGHW